MGFYPKVITEDILETVADYTEKAGDLRVGIDLLKRVRPVCREARIQKHIMPKMWQVPLSVPGLFTSLTP